MLTSAVLATVAVVVTVCTPNTVYLNDASGLDKTYVIPLYITRDVDMGATVSAGVTCCSQLTA